MAPQSDWSPIAVGFPFKGTTSNYCFLKKLVRSLVRSFIRMLTRGLLRSLIRRLRSFIRTLMRTLWILDMVEKGILGVMATISVQSACTAGMT